MKALKVEEMEVALPVSGRTSPELVLSDLDQGRCTGSQTQFTASKVKAVFKSSNRVTTANQVRQSAMR